jgi:L-seryl-tRNA(Ser) seleniumtransferase
MREKALAGNGFVPEDAEAMALVEAGRLMTPSLRGAINMSGVILHTGLGRARLAPEAAAQLALAAGSHAAVEFDLESGKRGDRQEHVRGYLCDLTGAEDALVVNNAAAGVFLVLNALCAGGEVILSVGQMVEIGGSFRMPDIVRQSGCTLVGVGCTNKTHLRDYQEAMSEETIAILRCHPSNFKMVGFVEEVEPADLARLADDRGIYFIDDVGSGCIVDTTQFGLSRQATLQDSLEAGADVVIASGDKLLGGPQAGLILGSKDCLKEIKSHPLARAVRVDKLTLAALEATLRLYATGRATEVPTIKYLSRPAEEVRASAERMAAAAPGSVLEEGLTEVGGGSLPGEGIRTWRVGVPSADADGVLERLRRYDPPIIGRIEDGRVWLDPRTAEDDEVAQVEKALEELFG